MNILIVESNADLALLWAAPLRANGCHVAIARGQREAVDHLRLHQTDVIVLDLTLDEGAALAVSDFAQYRQPQTRILAVTRDRFFSDGSIFEHIGNARALLPRSMSPGDISAVVEHYAAAS